MEQQINKGSFFYSVPKTYFVIFCWFSFATVTSLYSLVSFFTPSHAFGYKTYDLLISLAQLALNFSIVFGLYKRAKWVRVVSVVWYFTFLCLLILAIFTFEHIYSKIGYNIGPSSIFDYLLVLISIGLYSAIFFYLFRKAEFKK